MSKKKYLAYTLINKLEVTEKKRFKDYLNFYFRKPKPYLQILDIINKLNLKQEKDADFPEEILINKIDDSKNFTKLKYNFKTALYSFLRLLFLDDENNPSDQTQILKKYLNNNVLAKYQEFKHFNENTEILSSQIENTNSFEALNALLPILTADNLEIIIPVNGWKNSEEKYKLLHEKFLQQINGYKDFISSKYLKRSLFFSKDIEFINTCYKEISELNKSTKSFEAKIQTYLGITRYYFHKKEYQKEIDTLKMIIELIDKKKNKNLQDLTNILNSIKTIFLRQEETISQEEFSYYLKKFNTYCNQLSPFYLSQYSTSYNTSKLLYAVLFQKEAHEIKYLLESLNLDINKDYLRENAITHIKYLENYCFFLSNQIEKAHSNSSNFNFELKQHFIKFLLIRTLSAFILFEDPFISSEYRKIKRLIQDSNNELHDPLNELLKILHSYKTNKLKPKTELISDMKNYISCFDLHLERTDKRILNHFIDFIKK